MLNYLKQKPEKDYCVKNKEHHEGFFVVEDIVLDGRGDGVVEVETSRKPLRRVGKVVGVGEEHVEQAQVNYHELDHREVVVEVSFE